MKEKLITYLRAGYAALYAVTYEEDRASATIASAAKEIGYNLWTWSCTSGLRSPAGGVLEKTNDPMNVLKAFIPVHPVTGQEGEFEGTNVPNKSIVLLKDFHMYLKKDKADPTLLRLFKDAIQVGRLTNRHLVIVGCQLNLPPELEKDVTVVEFTMPTRDELKAIAESLCKAKGIELNDNAELIMDAGSGLTSNEFADAASFSLIDKGVLDTGVIGRIKAETIKKTGILEIVENKVTLDDIGGLDILKAELFSNRKAFTKAARDYGLPSPRALLLCGNPGTGKSLGATACGSIFGVPLIRLEAGRLFGSLVGESERNWRTAFATAKAIAPVVFWVDEVDGLFKGGGENDGGTTARVIKAIIQDMQFNSEGIFFVFTCNDIDALPDPLIDRCDLWNVELPNAKEREAIWKIQIAKRKRNPDTFDLSALSARSEGFSGRQIEQAWIKAMTKGFNDGGREPVTPDVLSVLREFVPTSVTMKDAIERRRQRLAGCAKPASTAEVA